MDGFDDLLDNSRANPILENPFEDPFARPRSPDPWLTFSPHVADAAQTAGIEQPQSPVHPKPDVTPTQQENLEPVDPLDAKAANLEDEVEDARPLPPQLPSITSPSQPSPTIPPPPSVSEADSHPKPLAPAREASPSPPSPSTEPVQTLAPASQQPPSPKLPPTPPVAPSPSFEASSSIPTSTRSLDHSSRPNPPVTRPAVVSPLESGSRNGQPSFSTLALGGEMPGWQGTTGNQARSNYDEIGISGGWGVHGNSEDFVNGAQRIDGDEDEDEDDDDDLPIAQRKPHSVSKNPPANVGRTPEIQPMFVITVGDPQKVGDPVRPFITYTVHTRTTSPLYRTSSFSVLRRYSDFLWLYETLSINNPGVIVPPVPEKQQYGRFQDTFVENRRAALNKCIQKIANHPSLRDDPDLKLFLESDSFVLDSKHRKAEIAHERGGLMASIGSTLVGPRFYETDEWFDNKKAYLDSLESQLRGLVKAIDMVSKQRNEVALSMAEFSENVATLASCDMSKKLSQTLSVLADVQRKGKELQDLQAREDVSTIMSTVDEYARLVNSVRLAFSSRVRLYTSWQHADSDVRKIQQAHEKARRQGRVPSDRLSSSLAEIAEAERRAMEAKQDFDNASKMIKSELARFEQERVEDFKNSLVAFLDGMIARQKEIIHSWETYQESLLKRISTSQSRTVSQQEGQSLATE